MNSPTDEPVPAALAARIASDHARPPVATVGARSIGLQGALGLVLAQLAAVGALAALGVRPGTTAMLVGPVLIATVGLAFGGAALGREAIPGRAPALEAWLGAAVLGVAAFALLVVAQADPAAPHRGLGCLAIGAGLALVPAAIGLLALRRGYAVRPRLAGAMVGGLSAVVGMSALHLHCPDLSIGHVGAVHGAVGVVMTLAGAAVGPRMAQPQSTDAGRPEQVS